MAGKKTWTEKEVLFMKTEYQNHGPEYCAKKLGKSTSAVSSKAYELGLRKSKK